MRLDGQGRRHHRVPIQERVITRRNGYFRKMTRGCAVELHVATRHRRIDLCRRKGAHGQFELGLRPKRHIAHLGGALFAWLYLRFGEGGESVFEEVKLWRTRRRWEKVQREKEKMAAEMEDIDPILEKIARHGIQSLSREEKQKLDRVSALKRSQKGNIIPFEDYRSRR